MLNVTANDFKTIFLISNLPITQPQPLYLSLLSFMPTYACDRPSI